MNRSGIRLLVSGLGSLVVGAAVCLALAQGVDSQQTEACDLLLDGGLVVAAGTTKIIEETNLCVNFPGLRVYGSLRLIDTRLNAIQTKYQEFENRVIGFFEMQGSTATSEMGLVFCIEGEALIEDSTLSLDSRFSCVGGTARAEIARSVLGGVEAGPRGSRMIITDSSILDLVDLDVLSSRDCSVKIEGLREGMVDWDSTAMVESVNWNYGHLTLNNTEVAAWRVRLGGPGSSVSIRDSDVQWLDCQWAGKALSYGPWAGVDDWEGTGPNTITDTTIGRLNCLECGHTIEFEGSHIAEWEVVDSSMAIYGDVQFAAQPAQFVRSDLYREFPARLVDSQGRGVAGKAVELLSPTGERLWSGITDSDGRVAFGILFASDDWDAPRVLRDRDSSLQTMVFLWTKTPLLLTVSN